MTWVGVLYLACAAVVIGGICLVMWALLSANDTAAERQNLQEQLDALKADADARRRLREDGLREFRRGRRS